MKYIEKYFEFKGWTIFPDKICAINEVGAIFNRHYSDLGHQFSVLLDGGHTIKFTYTTKDSKNDAKKGRDEFIELINRV